MGPAGGGRRPVRRVPRQCRRRSRPRWRLGSLRGDVRVRRRRGGPRLRGRRGDAALRPRFPARRPRRRGSVPGRRRVVHRNRLRSPLVSRRHDADAGGPSELLEAKAALRERVWSALKDADADRFPGAEGRIPNFIGAEDAAERLRGLGIWGQAATLKANPDSPQWPVRQRALEDGKRVYMAVPRLADPRPFFLLHPERIEQSPRKASSIKGAGREGRPVEMDALEPVDLVVVGSVAVSEDGARLGKGGGFSDLEFALAREAGLIGADTVVATTVHEVQLVDPGQIPMADHDVPLDWIVTPDRAVRCQERHARSGGIRWDALTEEKIAAIPLLARIRGG
ncbi:MAG: 5-formyltetrahydrofolate cyclo-ligase [Gemmatimonadetes bacterium]|nr:5-formyltetrahydrofolate cyclo-ligase [Gemmatimonadota bacterium]